jgi:hypothetical protein
MVFEDETLGFHGFSQKLYLHLGSAYSKFHKMDPLCKLGFLCSEILLEGYRDVLTADPFLSGVVLANASSSFDTDLKYHRLKQESGPSPAVFLYTLPNVVIGEICIRHGLKGENIFFIDDQYNIDQQVDYINLILDESIVKFCIGGWVEFLDDHYDGFLYLTTKQDAKGLAPLNSKSIEQFYKH